MRRASFGTPGSLAGLWILLLVPPVRDRLESTMSAHMLLHIPAFILIGWGVGGHLMRHYPPLAAPLRPLRWSLLICSAFTLGIWMIPRLLDLAAGSFLADLVKATTLTFAGGLPLKLGWINAGPVLRGLIHIEVMASLVRLGWIYAESPARLCTSYGLADQYWLGASLITVGGGYAVVTAWRALNGPASLSGFAPR